MHETEPSALEKKLDKGIASLGRWPFLLTAALAGILAKWWIPKYLDSSESDTEKAKWLSSTFLLCLLLPLILKLGLQHWQLVAENQRLKSRTIYPKRYAVLWDERDNALCCKCREQVQKFDPDRKGYVECPYCKTLPIRLDECGNFKNLEDAREEIRELRKAGKL